MSIYDYIYLATKQTTKKHDHKATTAFFKKSLSIISNNLSKI